MSKVYSSNYSFIRLKKVFKIGLSLPYKFHEIHTRDNELRENP